VIATHLKGSLLDALAWEGTRLRQRPAPEGRRETKRDQRRGTQYKLVVRVDFLNNIFMINYKFRSCCKKWTYISLSAAQRPIWVLSVAHWPIDMCSLLGRRACYCADVHATVQRPAVHHVISLGAQKYIFKVQGPM
jgi:hypothetical protein